MPMQAQARKAMRTIRRCVEAGRVMPLSHFRQRMAQRGMVWADVLAVLEDPTTARGDGEDDWGRPRWIVSGDAADGLAVGMVCVIDQREADASTVFITLFWED